MPIAADVLPGTILLAVALAKDDPCIRLLLAAVPEFEDSFDGAVAADPETGPFEAVSDFAQFAVDLLGNGDVEVARRAFAAVELLAASDTTRLALAGPLVAEFVEAVVETQPAVEALGPATRTHRTT